MEQATCSVFGLNGALNRWECWNSAIVTVVLEGTRELILVRDVSVLFAMHSHLLERFVFVSLSFQKG